MKANTKLNRCQTISRWVLKLHFQHYVSYISNCCPLHTYSAVYRDSGGNVFLVHPADVSMLSQDK